MGIFPTRILLAVDGSEDVELAARMAVDLAEETGSELHVVHVGVAPNFLTEGPRAVGYDHVLYGELERESREALRKLTWRVKLAGGTVAEAHLRMGGVAEEVVSLAERLGAGLIVVGGRDRGGLRRVLVGSVSGSIVRRARCSVMVVPS